MPGQKVESDFRPLTDKEKQIFLPLLCDVATAPNIEYDTSTMYACSNLVSGSGDPPGLMSFTSIDYGGFSKPNTDEALVIFYESGNGEAGKGIAGALFARQKGKWKLSDRRASSALEGCLSVPSQGRPQRMLCLDSPMWCCGQSSETVNLVTWAGGLHAKPLVTASGGRIDDPEGYCKRMNNGKPHLQEISGLQSSTEAGVHAEAKLEYLTSDAIAKACAQNKPGSEQFVEDRLRFVPDGDTVKVVLPAPLQGTNPTPPLHSQ